jgi:hypothetical protein
MNVNYFRLIMLATLTTEIKMAFSRAPIKSPSVCTCKLKHSQCADCIDMESSSDCLFSVKISLTYNVRWFYSPTVI